MEVKSKNPTSVQLERLNNAVRKGRKNELERWLNLVEDKAGEYVYGRGITEVRKRHPDHEQSDRLREAVRKGTISEQLSSLRRAEKMMKKVPYDEAVCAKCAGEIRHYAEILEALSYPDMPSVTETLEKTAALLSRASRKFIVKQLSTGYTDEYKQGQHLTDKRGRDGIVEKTWKYKDDQGQWYKCARCTIMEPAYDANRYKLDSLLQLFAYIQENGESAEPAQGPVLASVQFYGDKLYLRERKGKLNASGSNTAFEIDFNAKIIGMLALSEIQEY